MAAMGRMHESIQAMIILGCYLADKTNEGGGGEVRR
jgi:hypothetical protein